MKSRIMCAKCVTCSTSVLTLCGVTSAVIPATGHTSVQCVSGHSHISITWPFTNEHTAVKDLMFASPALRHLPIPPHWKNTSGYTVACRYVFIPVMFDKASSRTQEVWQYICIMHTPMQDIWVPLLGRWDVWVPSYDTAITRDRKLRVRLTGVIYV